MADRKILTHLDFLKASEIQNVLVHKLAAAPGSPVEGQLYYDTVTHKLFFYNGTTWLEASAQGIIAGNALKRVGEELHVEPGTGLEISADTIRIAATAAGAGLAGGGGAELSVNPGVGIIIEADAVKVDTATIATKAYVESVAQGLDVKNSVVRATNAALPTNEIKSATVLEATAVGALSIDGSAVSVNDRVLIKNEAEGKKNGIYTVTQAGGGAEKYKLTRTTDADAAGELSGGTFVFVEAGTENADTGWVISEPTGSVTPGTTVNTWTQFTGLGGITAGEGIGKLASQLYVEAGEGLTQTPDGLKINTAVTATKAYVESVAGKFTQNIGNGALTAIEVTHNLATRDVEVEVYRNSTPWDTIDCTVERTSTNIVTLRFNTAPTTEQFRVVVKT